MKRRQFIQGMGVGALGLAASLGQLPGLRLRYARAASKWGDFPDYAAATILPTDKQAKNVLDIFLYGGLSPWETFYVVPEYGMPTEPDEIGQQWWTFQEGNNNVQELYEACHGTTVGPMLQDFRIDDHGMMVRLGPFTEPLRQRKDIIERLRIHVLSHTLEPHEAAIPLGLSGFRLGAPKLAGVGAAIQHHHQAHSTIFTGEPSAYVLYAPGDFPTDNLRAASAVGQHPGSARPLAIRVQPNPGFIDALERKQIGDLRPQFDMLLNQYLAQYNNRLVWPGAPEAARSQTVADYQFTLDTMQSTDQLVGILEPSYFKKLPGEECGDSANINHPHMGLRLAAHLLTRPNSLARYVCVVDGGLIPASGGGGYDTHEHHIHDSARNLTNLWKGLINIINEPGENDPSKLNLDETLICINTEFGRTPWPQNGHGRNHHPYAYTTMMFGGPIGPDQQGIVGAIGPSGYATGALSPAQTRAAILAALGIFPFAPECYAVSDVFGTGSEAEAAMYLNEVVLGVKSST
jgi:hypothetical protein